MILYIFNIQLWHNYGNKRILINVADMHKEELCHYVFKVNTGAIKFTGAKQPVTLLSFITDAFLFFPVPLLTAFYLLSAIFSYSDCKLAVPEISNDELCGIFKLRMIRRIITRN